jgi:hypothetical protein
MEILIRADSHYCAPEEMDFCRAQGLHYILGRAPSSTLRARVAALEQGTMARYASGATHSKLRRHKEFLDGVVSWSRVERIIARVEASDQGTDTRFIVTNITSGNARMLCEDLYCRRRQAENHIKSWKTYLVAGRSSCCRASANQLRLMLHTGAYWLLWSLRRLMPARSSCRGCPVRYAAPAAAEDRRPGRRVHNQGHSCCTCPAPAPTAPSCGSPSSVCRAWSSKPRGRCRPERSRSPQPQASRSALLRRHHAPAVERACRKPSRRCQIPSAHISQAIVNFTG